MADTSRVVIKKACYETTDITADYGALNGIYPNSIGHRRLVVYKKDYYTKRDAG